jgi:hypothetical protein
MMDRRNFIQTAALGFAASSIGLSAEPVNDTDVAWQVPPAGTTLYVAPNGNDRNPGSESRPFATLARAKSAVREVKKTSKDTPVTVLLRAGTYYQPSTLVFEADDSGTNRQTVTYMAYPGEVATLSGGRRLAVSWRPYRDGIVMCDLPEVKTGTLSFTQLFINGRRQVRARFPNYDPQEPFHCRVPHPCQGGSGGGYLKMADREVEWPARHIYFDPQTFTKKAWKKPTEAVIHAFPETHIGNVQWRVAGIDAKNNALLLGRGGYQINDLAFKKVCTGVGPKGRFYVENVFEELDAPAEWYLDHEAGILYYMPPAGVDMNTAVVEVPVLKHVIEVRGTQDAPVRHVRFSGFRIAHTASTFLEEYDAPSLGDWTIYRGGAVLFEGTEDCLVENCFFDAVGGNGVFVNDYSLRTRVVGNKFTEAGDSAVCLVGTKAKAIGSNRPYSSECVISNNLVHDCGVFGKQVAGAFASISEKTTISHNVVYSMPRAGIVINDGWGGGHIVEFNEVFDSVKETQDHGSFNSWGRETHWCMQQSHPHVMPGVSHTAGPVKEDARMTTIVRNNYFHEDRFNEWGMVLDDGTSNYHVYNNLFLGVAITHREGDFRVIENNVMVYPKNPPGPKVSYEDNSDRFVKNIIVTSKEDGPSHVGNQPGDVYSIILTPTKGRISKEIDYNLFFSDGGDAWVTLIHRDHQGPKRHTFAEWKKMGYDEHSLFADPLFVDPENGDFRVKPESPALKLGFQNFDVSKAGLLPDFPKQWLTKEEQTRLAGTKRFNGRRAKVTGNL